MADDIVKRLRLLWTEPFDAVALYETINATADEIERMQAEIVRLRAECDDLRCENAQLRVDLGAAYCRMDDMEGYNDD